MSEPLASNPDNRPPLAGSSFVQPWQPGAPVAATPALRAANTSLTTLLADEAPGPGRRALLGGMVAVGLVPCAATPARATLAAMQDAMAKFTGSAEPRVGRIRIEIPPLVESGNSVPVSVAVESPMTETEHVRRIAVFNEKNPQPNVALFRLSPRTGVARVATRMRLGDSQVVVAIAELSDGSFWQASADVVVTLPACVEN